MVQSFEKLQRIGLSDMGSADIIGYVNRMLKLFKVSLNKLLGQGIPEMKVELQ